VSSVRQEQQLQIADEVIDTVGSDLRSAFRLGENESTLENGLGVERKRLGGPIGAHAPIPHRRFDISFQRRGMAADAAVSLAGWNWSSCPTTAIQFRVDSALTAAPILTTQAYGPAKAVNWAKRESAAARAASGAVIVTHISSGRSSNSKARKLQRAYS